MSLENLPYDHARETLLEHHNFVRSLALRLCRTGEEAEDLAQSTWVAALGSKPDPQVGLRPWLAKVLRSVRFTDRRTDARRRDREILAHSEDPVQGPQELAERVETQQRLIAAVLDLPEPYRDALLQSFYEGKTVAEIADRSGVSVNTIKSRRSRALANLREELDRSAGGDRSAWLAALAPWVDPSASNLPPGTGFGPSIESAIGVKTMAWMTASATGLVLGGFGLVAWVSGGTPGNPIGGSAGLGTSGPIAPAESDRPSPQEPEEEEPEEQVAPLTASLVGRIHWPEDIEVPDREPLEIRDGHPCAPEDRFSRELRIDGERGIQDVLVLVKVPDALAEVPEDPVVLSGEQGHLSPAIVVLPPGGTLRLEGGQCQTCNFHGYTRKNESFNLTVQEGSPRDILLTRPERFEVRDDLRPWTRSHVVVTTNPHWAVTDSRGKFTIVGLPAGEYEVELWHPRLGRQSARVSFAAGEIIEWIRALGPAVRRR